MCVPEEEQHVSGCSYSWWYWPRWALRESRGADLWVDERPGTAWPWEEVSENVLTEGSVMPRGWAGGAQGKGGC